MNVNQALNLFLGAMTLTVLVCLCLAMAAMIVYAIDPKAFDRKLDEIHAMATLADKDGDK